MKENPQINWINYASPFPLQKRKSRAVTSRPQPSTCIQKQLKIFDTCQGSYYFKKLITIVHLVIDKALTCHFKGRREFELKFAYSKRISSMKRLTNRVEKSIRAVVEKKEYYRKFQAPKSVKFDCVRQPDCSFFKATNERNSKTSGVRRKNSKNKHKTTTKLGIKYTIFIQIMIVKNHQCRLSYPISEHKVHHYTPD